MASGVIVVSVGGVLAAISIVGDVDVATSIMVGVLVAVSPVVSVVEPSPTMTVRVACPTLPAWSAEVKTI